MANAKLLAKIERDIREQTEELFELPGSEEVRDNIWDMYIEGSVSAYHGDAIVTAARKLYEDIFEEIATKHGAGKETQERKRFIRRLAVALKDRVKAYKKIDPQTYQPTAADLARLDEVDLGIDCTFLDLVKQLTGLVELSLSESGDPPKPGGPKALAAAIAAPRLRRLVLNDDVHDALAGAIANPTLAKVDYLALYETSIKPPEVAAALKRWPDLETLAFRGAVSARMLDVVATAAPRLVELALVDAGVKDAALEQLFTKRPWPKLERLFLWGHELGAPTKKKLAAALPEAKIKAGD